MTTGRTLQPADPLREDTFRPANLGPLGRGLRTGPPADALDEIGLDELLAGRLASIVDRHADHLGGVDASLAAASWTNHLVTHLLPSPLTAWTLYDVGLDASAANIAIHLEDGRPVGCRIRDPSRADRGPQARERTLVSLGPSLAELCQVARQAAGLPETLVWTHVGNLAAYLFDRLEEAGLADARQQADRERLLEADEAVWDGQANPLQGTVRYEQAPGEDRDRHRVREVCCWKVQLDGRTPCASCPRVDAGRRAHLLGERRARR